MRCSDAVRLRCRAALAIFTADPELSSLGAANMLEAAAAVHGIDPQLEQTALIRAFEYCLPSERLTRGVTLAELGGRLRRVRRSPTGRRPSCCAGSVPTSCCRTPKRFRS